MSARDIAWSAPDDDGMQRGITFQHLAARLTFLLRGPKGVVQFAIGTGWEAEPKPDATGFYPYGMYVGHHTPLPQYPGEQRMDDCDLLPAGECYYDGSTLAADAVLKAFRTEGEAAVWAALADRYADLNHVPDEVPPSVLSWGEVAADGSHVRGANGLSVDVTAYDTVGRDVSHIVAVAVRDALAALPAAVTS